MTTNQKSPKLLISRITSAGTEGNDTLNATTTGAYNLYGYGGNDILNGNFKDDSIWGGNGNDTLTGGADKDTLFGDAGDDVISGDAGNDSIQGGDGNDTLTGGLDNDSLDGGAGDDFLSGDAGNNTLQGGYGNDTAIYATALFSDVVISESSTPGTFILTTPVGVDQLTSR